MTARLHVLIGDGGVGKTTLSAAYALALAGRGRHVGLLGVDPARRLETALGIPVDDRAVRVPVPGILHAAHLVPATTLGRWVTEGLATADRRARVLDNAFFRAMAERLATTTDVIGAVRVAEWLEADPSLTDIVVDTAPGRNGLELLARPEALLAFGRGRLLRWLAHAGGDVTGGLRGRVLASVRGLTGLEVLGELGALVEACAAPAQSFARRLEAAHALLRAPATEVVLVTAVRADALRRLEHTQQFLASAGLRASTIAVNGALPEIAAAEVSATPPDPAARGILRLVRADLALQAEILVGVRRSSARVVVVPTQSGLDAPDRLDRLTALGAVLA